MEVRKIRKVLNNMIREDWINYFNNLSLLVMFTNQFIFIHITKGLFREYSVQKSVHSRYIVGTQSVGFQIHPKLKKPQNKLF